MVNVRVVAPFTGINKAPNAFVKTGASSAWAWAEGTDVNDNRIPARIVRQVFKRTLPPAPQPNSSRISHNSQGGISEAGLAKLDSDQE
jgi:hypothetical protein